MPSKRKFYRHTVTIEILSEESEVPVDAYGAVGGPDSHVICDVKSEQVEEIDGPTMAKAATEARSDPEFFELDDEGNDLDE